MNSDTKKEFLQKYKLDNYSRAVPVRRRLVKTASLGEYCEPVDSRKIRRGASEESEDYNSDPDNRYAQPQDAIDVKLKQSMTNSGSNDDNGDVYDLAHVSDEVQGQSPQKKPSPKPRTAKQMTPGRRHSSSRKDEDEDTEITHKDSILDCHESSSEPHAQKKRPGKKVVEIEYEVASAIRLNKPGETPLSGRDLASTRTSIISDIKNPQSALQFSKLSLHDSSLDSKPTNQGSKNLQTQQSESDFVYSMSQAPPPPGTMEDTYEEPWDLKMKRFKQEQENKGKQLAKWTDKVPGTQRTVAVYDNAWHNSGQKHKLEDRLSYVRSQSQTSEADVFHDALDSFADTKIETKPAENIKADHNPAGKLKPLPQNTYEDAWDLKNSLLEKKIREMQLLASAVYEEPWDLNKQQIKLQAKLLGNNPATGAGIGGEQEKSGRNKSTSEAQNTTQEGSETSSSVSRGKYHSFGEGAGKSRGHGCNIGQRINPMIPLASQNWYHGNISREDAEKMLCVCKEGSYIVRISSDRKSYSLSIKSVKQYIHVQIDQRSNEDGTVCYILGKNSKEFCTIPEMIDYYTHHRVPLKGAEHITLLHPVECKWS